MVAFLPASPDAVAGCGGRPFDSVSAATDGEGDFGSMVEMLLEISLDELETGSGRFWGQAIDRGAGPNGCPGLDGGFHGGEGFIIRDELVAPAKPQKAETCVEKDILRGRHSGGLKNLVLAAGDRMSALGDGLVGPSLKPLVI